jgi:WD40 repeat protein
MLLVFWPRPSDRDPVSVGGGDDVARAKPVESTPAKPMEVVEPTPQPEPKPAPKDVPKESLVREMKLLTRHSDAAIAVAISPDGKWVASGGYDKMVTITDTATGMKRHELVGHTQFVNSVAIAPDGQWLASAGDTVVLWSADGQKKKTLDGHKFLVKAVAISSDGRWVASAGGDLTAKLWDAATGQERTLRPRKATGDTPPGNSQGAFVHWRLFQQGRRLDCRRNQPQRRGDCQALAHERG